MKRLGRKYCFLVQCPAVADILAVETMDTKISHYTTRTPLLPHNRLNLLGATRIKQHNYPCTGWSIGRESRAGQANPADSNSVPTHNKHYRTTEETTTTATQNSEWTLSTTPYTQVNYQQRRTAELPTQHNTQLPHNRS